MKKMLLILFLLIIPYVLADSASLNTTLSQEDKSKFDEILKPIFKIYNFIKYISTIVAAVFLLYAGIAYMTSGSDPKKRDQAKNIGGYVIIGLIIIWATPMIISLFI